MGSCIRQEKDIRWEIYQEGDFLRLLTHVHTAQPTVTPSPRAGEICRLKAPGTVYCGGLGHTRGFPLTEISYTSAEISNEILKSPAKSDSFREIPKTKIREISRNPVKSAVKS